uniref:Uncharacterized protein n=1 Tax=Sphingobacterium sp. (strain 21) TaxID=743722 RepID=F4C8W2_SPHS2
MTFKIKNPNKQFLMQDGKHIDFRLEPISTIPFRFHLINGRPEIDVAFIDANIAHGDVTFLTERGNQLSKGGLFVFLLSWVEDEIEFNREFLYNHQEFYLATHTSGLKARMIVISDKEPYQFEISFPKARADDNFLSNHKVLSKDGRIKYEATNDFRESSELIRKQIIDRTVVMMNKLADFKNIFG